jgi:hypothetical protein
VPVARARLSHRGRLLSRTCRPGRAWAAGAAARTEPTAAPTATMSASRDLTIEAFVTDVLPFVTVGPHREVDQSAFTQRPSTALGNPSRTCESEDRLRPRMMSFFEHLY